MKMASMPVRAQVMTGRGFYNPHTDGTEESRLALEDLMQSTRDAMRNSVSFRIDNVTEYLFAETEQEHWHMREDFPNVAPPFQNMWFETMGPSTVTSNDPVLGDTYGAVLHMYGRSLSEQSWGVLWTSIEAANIPPEIQHKLAGEVLWRDEQTRAREVGAKWIVTCSLALREHGRVLFPTAVHRFLVGPDGRAIDDGIVYVPESIIQHYFGQYGESEDVRRSAIDAMSAYFFPVYLAVSFCHCKNVVRTENLPSRQERRASEKADREFTKYYTLGINPMRTIIQREGDVANNGLKRALHIVRGHWRTYTPEHPLFGKYSGTWWWEDNIRGNAEEGVNIKNYDVKPNKKKG